jgi:hypothetical protein
MYRVNITERETVIEVFEGPNEPRTVVVKTTPEILQFVKTLCEEKNVFEKLVDNDTFEYNNEKYKLEKFVSGMYNIIDHNVLNNSFGLMFNDLNDFKRMFKTDDYDIEELQNDQLKITFKNLKLFCKNKTVPPQEMYYQELSQTSVVLRKV